MPVLNATIHSVNTAFVDIESRLDLCDIATIAGKLGVHLAAPQNADCGGRRPPSKLPTCLPSLTLGVKEHLPADDGLGLRQFRGGRQVLLARSS